MKNFYIGILIFFVSCTSNDELSNPVENTEKPVPVSPTAIQGAKNKFDTKSITNLVLLNQSVTFGKSISSKFTQNFFFTDDNGNIVGLKIPNAKSYTLNVTSLMECTKNLILISGNLDIEYLDGTKDVLNNFILDKTDGAFYKLSSESYSKFFNVYQRRLSSTPWGKGQLQFDDKNCVYLKGNSTGIIQEIFKAEFIKSNTETIEVKFTTLNIIAESYYFNYYILPNGDILYMHKENMNQMVWKLRISSSGETKSIVELQYNRPFIVNGTKYFESIDPSACFGVRSSDNGFILFIKGNESVDFTIGQNSFIKPFKLIVENSQLRFESIPTKTPAFENYLNTNFTLFTDYYHGMWYFNSNNFHVFTNRGYANEVKANIWWSFDDKTNTFKTSFTNYSNAEFTTYSQLLGFSDKFACVPIGRNVHFINLENLSNSTISDLGFQIFKTQYRNDDVLQFYGISYSTGKKVFGEINQKGSVKILNEFENNTVEVKDIIKIGNF